MNSMSDKKNNDEAQQEPAKALGELDQLRKIVFGDAQQAILLLISTLRGDMEKAFTEHEHKLSSRLNKMQNDFHQQIEDLGKKLNYVDKTHDDNETNLQKEHDNLVSEHEMFAAATQQDFKNIEESLNSESTTLSSNFNEQLEELKNHLEDVSKELSSSKTDRKTLAKLLATMATNLEDDQL